MDIWMVLRNYPAIVESGLKNFSVFFPDFPGCVSAGNTLEETCDMAREALTGHVQLMTEDGETIPDPTPMADLEIELGDACLFIPVEVPQKIVRISVTIEQGLLDRLDATAKKKSV
jgi:predicted RNase H-like HicB family nuclease